MQRLHRAPDIEHVEIEVVNALAPLYRLRERLKNLIGNGAMHALLAQESRQVASGIIWARNRETHHLIVLSKLEDMFPDRFSEMFGVPCWQPSPRLPVDHEAAHLHYSERVAGRPVAPTITEALAILTTLLAEHD